MIMILHRWATMSSETAGPAGADPACADISRFGRVLP